MSEQKQIPQRKTDPSDEFLKNRCALKNCCDKSNPLCLIAVNERRAKVVNPIRAIPFPFKD